MRATLLSALLIALLAASLAHAARLEVSSGEPLAIRISTRTPTVVTFPERIRAIPTSADPNAVSLETVEERLFIQSLQAGFEATVFVIGDSGRLHILHLVESATPDIEVQLVEPQSKIRQRFGEPAKGSANRRPGRAGRAPPSSPLRRLLVALLKGEVLPGVEVMAHEQVLAESQAVEIRTTHLYAAGRYLGFIGVARNRTAGPLVLRLPEIQAPGLKAIAADVETIPAAGETRVVLVVEPGSPY